MTDVSHSGETPTVLLPGAAALDAVRAHVSMHNVYQCFTQCIDAPAHALHGAVLTVCVFLVVFPMWHMYLNVFKGTHVFVCCFKTARAAFNLQAVVTVRSR